MDIVAQSHNKRATNRHGLVAFFIFMAAEILKTTSRNVAKFNEIYDEDRFKARIYCFENSPETTITYYNNVSPGVFQIYKRQIKYGVSKTMKRYTTSKLISSITVNKTKFYISEHKKIMPLFLNNIDKEYRKLFIEHFSWVRFLEENNINDLPFNSIVRHRLYSRDKVLRHMFGCNAETSMLINQEFGYKQWRQYKKSLTNIENLNHEIFEFGNKGIFIDTLLMAYKMNETVNAAWSKRRLKEEHDKWSKQYTDIVYEFNNRPLNLHPIFRELSKVLDGNLITNTKDLAIEGYVQHHCVATYTHTIDSGRTAIFNIDGYTAEIINSGHSLQLRQFRGKRNIEAPYQLKDQVEKRLLIFNEGKREDDFKISKTHLDMIPEDAEPIELPF